MISLICSLDEYECETGECKPCDVTCYTCKGPTSDDCLSCVFTRIFDEGQCVIECGSGKYQRDGRCHPCHYTCQECDDEGPDTCTACSNDKFGVERYLFARGCRDNCPDGQRPSSRSTCEPCSANCLACATEQRCTRCAANFYPKDGTCVKLECAVDELEDTTDNECVPCEEGCQKCLSVNPQHCISCLEHYYHLESTCHKICPERTFGDDASMTCRQCDDQCITCDDSECYLCEEAFFLSADGTCVSRCEEGFYGDSTGSCEPCHHNCRSCGGPEYSDCDSCEDGMRLVDGQCVDVSKAITCPPLHFVNRQGVCQPCHFSCKLCFGSRYDQCSACKEDMFLVADTHTCVPSCPSGTFGNRTSGNCETCLSGCHFCQEADHCIKCLPGRYLQNGSCVAECQKGYPDDGVCRSCASHCSSCEGDAQHCLSCELQYLLHEHACVDHCPQRYHIRADACERCPDGCADCDGREQCTECEEYYFLHEGRCLDKCPTGYSANSRKCSPCHEDCTDCDGPNEDNCLSCSYPMAVLYRGACLYTCPPNTYKDGTECMACDWSCLTCSGPGPASCLSFGPGAKMDTRGRFRSTSSCPPGTFFSERGNCRPCQPGCLLCEGPVQCLHCGSAHFLLNQTCVATCPDGYYGDEDGRECTRCSATCATCSSRHSTDCLTCEAGRFENEGRCVEDCPSRFYGNVTMGTCERCDQSCTECSGGSNKHCLACGEGYFLSKQEGTCVHTCPPHFFPDQNNVCQHCHPQCKTCKASGSVSCTSCFQGFKLIGSICSSLCIAGMYTTTTTSSADTCTACDPSCFECKGPGPYNCIGCHALERLSEDGRCLSCCGKDKPMDSSPLPWECCDCHNGSLDECILAVNYKFRSREELPTGSSSIAIALAIFFLLGLGLGVFLILHCRPKLRPLFLIKSKGYAKLDKEPAFTTATLRDSIQVEYCDKDEGDDDEEEDEIVYMGKDGTLYRKFKYGRLEQEEEDVDLEHDYSIHPFQ